MHTASTPHEAAIRTERSAPPKTPTIGSGRPSGTASASSGTKSSLGV